MATTLGRLVLNVATTRLILTRAATHGLDAAGGVVRAFGEFVAGDRVVVGLIIFVIIVVIQFVVITKGATRISEVAARFALDGMPGRQMAIDADLTAGLIDEKQAQRRRSEVTRQADFFGAMDGASKFVRGDAIAGIVIILINIVGGLFIGVVESGMNVRTAAEVFTKLTIGDGLVTQVPAFLISLAAALLVTRSSEETDLPRSSFAQFFSRPRRCSSRPGSWACLIVHALAALPLLLIGGGSVGLAVVAVAEPTPHERSRWPSKAASDNEAGRTARRAIPGRRSDGNRNRHRADSPGRSETRRRPARRVQRVRQNVAAEIGIVMPKVRIRDNTRLDQNQYRIKVADVPVAEGHMRPGMLLAIDSADAATERDRRRANAR